MKFQVEKLKLFSSRSAQAALEVAITTLSLLNLDSLVSFEVGWNTM